MKVVKEILEDLEDKIQFLDDRIVELLLRNISNEERKRMSENNEERRDFGADKKRESDRKIATARIILGEIREANQEKQSPRISSKKKIESFIVSCFKDENLKQEMYSFFKKGPKGDQCGEESCVWFDLENKEVIKAVNPYCYLKNEDIENGDLLNFIEDKIELYNAIFPETAYTLYGFDNLKIWDDIAEVYKMSFRVIMKQPFVEGISISNVFENFEKIRKYSFEEMKNYNEDLPKEIFDFVKFLSNDSNSNEDFENKFYDLISRDINRRVNVSSFKKVTKISKYIGGVIENGGKNNKEKIVINDLHGNNVLLTLDKNREVSFSYIDANPTLIYPLKIY